MVLVSAILEDPGNQDHGVMTHVLVKDDGTVADALKMLNQQPLQEIFGCGTVELVGIVAEEKSSDPNAKMRAVGPSWLLSACYNDAFCFVVKPCTEDQDSGSANQVARASKVSPTTSANRSPPLAPMGHASAAKGSAVLEVHSLTNNHYDSNSNSNSESEDSEAESESEEESTPQSSTDDETNDEENSEQSFEDGSKHFVRWKDGVEYPVTLLSTQANGMCLVRYDNYGSRQCKIDKKKLLPFTKKRKRDFDCLWEKTKAETKKQNQKRQEVAKKKNSERKRAKEQLRQAKRREERQKARLDRAQALKEAKEKEKADRQRFGKRLPRTDIPLCDIPGVVRIFETRRIYYAEDDEQPVEIADAFDIDVDCLLYHNRGNFPDIEKDSRLKPGTPLVLPPADD